MFLPIAGDKTPPPPVLYIDFYVVRNGRVNTDFLFEYTTVVYIPVVIKNNNNNNNSNNNIIYVCVYHLPMCCNFWEKRTNSHKIGRSGVQYTLNLPGVKIHLDDNMLRQDLLENRIGDWLTKQRLTTNSPVQEFVKIHHLYYWYRSRLRRLNCMHYAHRP